MINLYYRISNAFKIFFWALRNPKSLQESNFKMLSSLFELIMKVAHERTHYMSKVAIIHPDIEDGEIVSIWAGAGLGADPINRIEELKAENSRLRRELRDCLTK